jgi:hypothetical protein
MSDHDRQKFDLPDILSEVLEKIIRSTAVGPVL